MGGKRPGVYGTMGHPASITIALWTPPNRQIRRKSESWEYFAKRELRLRRPPLDLFVEGLEEELLFYFIFIEFDGSTVSLKIIHPSQSSLLFWTLSLEESRNSDWLTKTCSRSSNNNINKNGQEQQMEFEENAEPICSSSMVNSPPNPSSPVTRSTRSSHD
ncbi:hypothetical protein P175DRAFT_0528803 [Aspergillus ochraceoroseus IBT 24754]|uniref:Uncharacterized protein n=1 Tax=Aspergillus ochraceoroseus IBT 24754 TaxID=1392256 RepID=A0A2T5M9Q3_9EURO|nr:uncharacterized protein P175DRAFT_0528803 [Aspergillus ochraceoroseus IBT 24754]PTU25264.1 hypothetical protein P175DRAFT_0528803 [Aspergillus ochraceoroseus IBT 24754]